MIHGMLDIETMGNNTNAAITAIGLVLNDNKGNTSSFYQEVSLESSVQAGAKMDVSTILWWMQQEDDAREIYKRNNEALPLRFVLRRLNEFINCYCDVNDNGIATNLKLWGNGVGFDNVILRNSYNLFDDVICPFPFYNDACYRTLKGLYPDIKLERVGIYHNALNDAQSQMDHLLKLLNYMNHSAK